MNAGSGFSTDTSAGTAFAVQESTLNSMSGKSITFALSMTGYEDLVITFADKRLNSALYPAEWSYSTDGGSTFTSLGAATPPGSAATLRTLSAIPAADDVAEFVLRYTFGTVTNMRGGGSLELDNIQFNATALPPHRARPRARDLRLARRHRHPGRRDARAPPSAAQR